MGSSPTPQVSPPIPTRSPMVDSSGLATRTWISWFTWLGGIFATINSPIFTGNPAAPTAPPGTDNTQIATTAYADAAVAVEALRAEEAEASLETAITLEVARAEAAETLLAPLASPALTGTPTVPTASPGTNTTQAASTAYTAAAVAVEMARATSAEALKAPLASPSFTGTVNIGGVVSLNGGNPVSALSPSLGASSYVYSLFGVAASNYNSTALGFYNAGLSSSSNRGVLGIYGGANTTFDFSGNWVVPGLMTSAKLALTAAITATSATAGTATSLPTTPLGYVQITINSVNVKIPYYSV